MGNNSSLFIVPTADCDDCRICDTCISKYRPKGILVTIGYTDKKLTINLCYTTKLRIEYIGLEDFISYVTTNKDTPISVTVDSIVREFDLYTRNVDFDDPHLMTELQHALIQQLADKKPNGVYVKNYENHINFGPISLIGNILVAKLASRS